MNLLIFEQNLFVVQFLVFQNNFKNKMQLLKI